MPRSKNRFDAIELPPALAGVAPHYAFDRDSIRQLDHAAINEFGIPGAVLMENAATAIACVACAMLEQLGSREALILCGPGNNAGDGFALARKLANLDFSVRVALGADRDRLKGDAALNLRIIEAMGLPIVRVDDADIAGSIEQLWRQTSSTELVVDALFGTGLTTPPRKSYAQMIRWINTTQEANDATTTVLAIDTPSGLDCDTGAPVAHSAKSETNDVVRADVTVTLAGMKLGFLNTESRDWTGRVLAADIGVPRTLLDRLGAHLGALRAGSSPTRS